MPIVGTILATTGKDPMMTAPMTASVLLAPDGGEHLRFLGSSTMRLKLDRATNADVAVYEYVSEPGVTGPPQHVHHGHDETFHVVAGTYQFTIGTEVHVLPPGAFLYLPRGSPHTFYNSGDTSGRIVGTFNPPRSPTTSASWRRSSKPLRDPPEHEAWVELYARYDTTFYEC
jgi:mannose-6-phosphate isomerase-like protein (cupin superfamily)